MQTNWLKKLATLTSRTPDDVKKSLEPATVNFKVAAYCVGLAALIALFAGPFAGEVRKWSNIHAEVPLSKSDWHVVYSDVPGMCASSNTGASKCLANPSNPTLWQSPALRSDKGHVEKVNGLQGKVFWIGATFNEAQLRKAAKASAHYLALGYLNGGSRIYVNGELMDEGHRRSGKQATITLSQKSLENNTTLFVAIEITHDFGYPYPDYLMGPIAEGLFKNEELAAYQGYADFWVASRPFAFAMTNLMISVLFFIFWISAKTRQEHFYMAMYGLVGALIQVRSIEYVYLTMTADQKWSLDLFLRLCEGGFGMLLGLSFARFRRTYIQISAPIIIFGAIATITLLNSTLAKFHFSQFAGTYIIPSFYATAVAACLLQAYLLYDQRHNHSFVPARIKQLVAFAFGLSLVLALYHSQAKFITSATNYISWHRFAHLGVVAYLSAILIREYRAQELLIQKTPISEYHRRTDLPQKLSGALLIADLKDSEKYYRQRAEHADSDDWVSVWRSHFYAAVLKHGGVVLQKKGDELICFFDNDKIENPALAALSATQEMVHNSKLLKIELGDQTYFRAAVTTGHIRPVWETFGKNKEPYWEEAGNSSPFVELSRLLELERQLPYEKESTLVIVPERVSREVLSTKPNLAENFVVTKRGLPDKNHVTHLVSVFAPDLGQITPRKQSVA